MFYLWQPKKTCQKARKKNVLFLKYLVMRELLYPPCTEPGSQTSPTLLHAARYTGLSFLLPPLSREHPPLLSTAPLGLSLYKHSFSVQITAWFLRFPTSIFHMIPTCSSFQVLINQHPDVLLLTTVSFLFLFTLTISFYSQGTLIGQLKISLWYDE